MIVLMEDTYRNPPILILFTLSMMVSYLHPNAQSKQPFSQSKLVVTNRCRKSLILHISTPFVA